MTQEKLLVELIKIHERYSSDRWASDGESQFCTMWPMSDPPDILSCTEPLEAVCDLIDINLEEDYAVELFDMSLQETAVSLFAFMSDDSFE